MTKTTQAPVLLASQMKRAKFGAHTNGLRVLLAGMWRLIDQGRMLSSIYRSFALFLNPVCGQSRVKKIHFNTVESEASVEIANTRWVGAKKYKEQQVKRRENVYTQQEIAVARAAG